MEKTQPPPYTQNANPPYPNQEYGFAAGAAPPPPVYTNEPTTHPQVYPVPTTTTTIVTTIPLSSDPQNLKCPYCQYDVRTETKYKEGRFTHILALVLCLVGCWCCCCIPYCMDSCKDGEHYCPQCKRLIGIHRRL